jgi:hypothetical protein
MSDLECLLSAILKLTFSEIGSMSQLCATLTACAIEKLLFRPEQELQWTALSFP